MNLADAIRKAATEGSVPMASDATSVFPNPAVLAEAAELETVTDDKPVVPPEPPNVSVLNGNVVRIELFMTAEQSTSMLRAIMTGQHTVLTLAEAAHYLRIRPLTLAKMAEDNELPCVEIDGKWRFLKHHLDEWLYSIIGQTDSEEENQDVA